MMRIGKLESQKDLENYAKKYLGGTPANPPKEPDNLFEDWRALGHEDLVERVKKEYGYFDVREVEFGDTNMTCGLVEGVGGSKMEYAYYTFLTVRGAKRKGCLPSWRTESIYELYVED